MKCREMHAVVEKGTRGEICCISHKYATANNPYVQNNFVLNDPISYILYLDMNNLYGTAMSEQLPLQDCKY